MSKILFIGDTHFGHKGISNKFRTCFSSDEEHDETIHKNILEAGSKRDTLVLCGDICFKQKEFWRIEEYAKVYQHIFVVLGNHEYASFAKDLATLSNVTVCGIIKKWGMWISHAPIHPQELYGKKNVHGHVHSNTVPDTENYINVSCEAVNYKPISLQELRQ